MEGGRDSEREGRDGEIERERKLGKGKAVQ